MNEEERLRIRDSRRMSLILRHRPADFRVMLDAHGWTTVEELSHGSGLTVGRILEIAENNTRYELSDDRLKVRALHGHSVHVAYEDEVEPPSILYHGTSDANLELILESGSILPMGREKVHLSGGIEKATDVARRRGSPMIIAIDAHRMHVDGHIFYLSRDGIYLVDCVPVDYFIETFPADRLNP